MKTTRSLSRIRNCIYYKISNSCCSNIEWKNCIWYVPNFERFLLIELILVMLCSCIIFFKIDDLTCLIRVNRLKSGFTLFRPQILEKFDNLEVLTVLYISLLLSVVTWLCWPFVIHPLTNLYSVSVLKAAVI